MVELTNEARAALTAGKLAHLVTLNRDGSPQVSVVWIDLDGDEIVTAHEKDYLKLRNVRRDPRVTLSVESDSKPGTLLAEHIIVHGRARVVRGGAVALLRKLGKRYVAPDFEFSFAGDPTPDYGYVLRIEIDRIGGVGPWNG
ncbi:PPOX class F420-dependent oxidoreductase [Nocardia sp. NPDC004750]